MLLRKWRRTCGLASFLGEFSYRSATEYATGLLCTNFPYLCCRYALQPFENACPLLGLTMHGVWWLIASLLRESTVAGRSKYGSCLRARFYFDDGWLRAQPRL